MFKERTSKLKYEVPWSMFQVRCVPSVHCCSWHTSHAHDLSADADALAPQSEPGTTDQVRRALLRW